MRANEGRAEAISILSERLAPHEIKHCLRVEALAGDLAAAHGVDVERTRMAGLLHDYCRAMDHADLLVESVRVGIEVTEIELREPYLLHARLGAVLLREEQGIDDYEILQAVASHTLGSEHMGLMDACVFLADHLEPGRRKSYVGTLRELAMTDLWGATRQLFAAIICRTIEKGKPIHPIGASAWNSLIRSPRLTE